MSFDAPATNKSCCPASPEYQEVIDFAARFSYNPELLGDINELKNKHNCTIQSPSDAVDKAVSALHELDPSITGYRVPDGVMAPERAGIGSTLSFQNGELKVSNILPYGPAAAADLKPGDKITSVDGKRIGQSTTTEDIHNLMTAKKSSLGGSIGIGMSREENGPIQISQVEPKSAAEAAGLMQGDKILAVDGTATSSKQSLLEVNQRLEGRDGSKVHLMIERGGERVGLNLIRRKEDYPTAALNVERDGKTLEVTVPRRPVIVESVRARYGNDEVAIGGQTLPPDSTYIKIDNFFAHDTTDKIWKALQQQPLAKDAKTDDKNSTPVNSVILDLRDNLGGRLDDAVLVSSLFVDKGDVYKANSRVPSDPSTPEYGMETISLNDHSTIKTTTGGDAPKTVTEPRTPLASHPKQLIVLVNDRTTGSAELLAESLQANAGATVIGTETRGYGITQLGHLAKRDTMLLIPHSHLFAPNGRWLGNGHTIRNGVVPNLRVETGLNAQPGSDEDDMVRAAIKLINEKNK